MDRRSLFTRWLQNLSGSGAAPGAAEEQAIRPVPIGGDQPPFLRPPGARPEKRFLDLCERCTDCRDACPYNVILPLGPAYKEAEGTPSILPDVDACRLCEDLPCIQSCPSGALQMVPREEIQMGTAVLNPALCLAVQGQPCDDCIKSCPLGESALRWGGDRPEVVVGHCVGCGMCVEVCPARPRALSVRPAQT